MTLYEKIEKLCKNKGFPISNLGERVPNLKISKASITGWKNGSIPRAENIKAIADYFGVPTEYLVSDIAIDSKIVNDNYGINSSVNAPVKIINGSERELSEQEIELLNLYANLSVIEKAKLLVFASELECAHQENYNLLGLQEEPCKGGDLFDDFIHRLRLQKNQDVTK